MTTKFIQINEGRVKKGGQNVGPVGERPAPPEAQKKRRLVEDAQSQEITSRAALDCPSDTDCK